uniref:Uncharacterized protein n=1 Tax=Romanomermis culicivorax TaxID=13658 RepID=A0A915KB07_ROMCU
MFENGSFLRRRKRFKAALNVNDANDDEMMLDQQSYQNDLMNNQKCHSSIIPGGQIIFDPHRRCPDGGFYPGQDMVVPELSGEPKKATGTDFHSFRMGEALLMRFAAVDSLIDFFNYYDTNIEYIVKSELGGTMWVQRFVGATIKLPMNKCHN